MKIRIKQLYRIPFTFIVLFFVVMMPIGGIMQLLTDNLDLVAETLAYLIIITIIPIYYWFYLPRLIYTDKEVTFYSDFLRLKKTILLNDIIDYKYVSTPNEECAKNMTSGMCLNITSKTLPSICINFSIYLKKDYNLFLDKLKENSKIHLRKKH